MKKAKTTGLRAEPGQVSQGGGGLIYAIAVSALLMAAWGLCLGNAFPSSALPALGLGAIGAAAAILCCLVMRRLPAWAVFGAVTLGCLLAGVLFLNSLRGAFAALGSDISVFLTEKTGRIHLGFSNPGSGSIGLVLVTIPAAALAAAALTRGRLAPALPLYGLLLFGTASDFLGHMAAAVLTMLALMLHVLLVLQSGGNKRSRSLPVFCLPLVLLAGALLLAGGLYTGRAGTNLRQQVKDRVHALRFDSSSAALPEGKLSDLSEMRKNGTAALSVTMDLWQKSYFRGFVGESYTGTRWEETDSAVRAGQADAFYWLHEEGLYGQNLVGSAAVLAEQGETAAFTVRILEACSGHGYVPTALSGTGLLDSAGLGDAMVSGGDEFSGTYVPGGLTEWFRTRQELANRQQTAQVKTYLSSEEAYRRYVYDTCLNLTDASAAAIAALEGTERESLSLSQIKGRVLTILDANLTYNELQATENGENDFAAYVLQQTRSGYSVHYATLATLLLRWYGVPARYCEGYFVPADRAERYADGETVLLYETDAHAWTEYYLDGVGWIPFEATPPYRDDEEDRAGSGLSQMPQTYENNVTYTPPLPPQERVDTTGWRTLAGLSPLFALLLLPLALLALAVPVLLRRRKLKRALAAVRELPNREGVQQEYGYACCLLAAAGLAPDSGSGAAQINQLARFSNHEITDEQRQQVRLYSRQVLADCCKKWNFPRRLYYRFWKCLYL